MSYVELKPEHLRRKAQLDSLPDLSNGLDQPLGELDQPRALDAIDFAMGIDGIGYNAYALGDAATDMHTMLLQHLQAIAAQQPVGSDLCYVANLNEPGSALAMILPRGIGRRARDDVRQLLASLTSMIPAAFNSPDFHNQLEALNQTLEAQQLEDSNHLREEAKQRDVLMLPTPGGFVFAPARDGKALEQEAFDALPEAEKLRYTTAIEELTKALQQLLKRYPELHRQLEKERRNLVERTARGVLVELTATVRDRYRDHKPMIEHLDAVSAHLLENVDRLIALHEAEGASPRLITEQLLGDYQINLLVDRSSEKHAPVVYESNPSLENLVGKIDTRLESGYPTTHFSLIRPGALHRANGGYLLLDAERLISKPFAWEALKRALNDESLRIESVNQMLSISYSVSLEAEPITLKVKVVLIGPRLIHHLLRAYDTEYAELFKVLADFADEVSWSPANEQAYAALLLGFAKRNELLPLTADAIAAIIEFGGRAVEDQTHLSARTEALFDMVREANHMAHKNGATEIQRTHVSAALSKRQERIGRIRELTLRNIERGLIQVETSGQRVGQVNGLSVMQLGKLVFGQPARITATARVGRGEFVDIEREAKLGGNIHSKALLIVSSFIGYRYAKERPLSLHASLVFEQSYGGIEGDSATVAEVCALLSAILDQPLRQDIAITGSMDQHGRVQAIGGVNEKVEGFFAVCEAAGLTGTQGVLIPASNRDSLMLDAPVIAAVTDTRFHIYTMERIDDAISLMFGTPEEPASVTTIDQALAERLEQLHALWRDAHRGSE